jgi:hypothetical protein
MLLFWVDLLILISPIARKSVSPSHSTFKPRVSLWLYLYLAFDSAANANATAFAIT